MEIFLFFYYYFFLFNYFLRENDTSIHAYKYELVISMTGSSITWFHTIVNTYSIFFLFLVILTLQSRFTFFNMVMNVWLFVHGFGAEDTQEIEHKP